MASAVCARSSAVCQSPHSRNAVRRNRNEAASANSANSSADVTSPALLQRRPDLSAWHADAPAPGMPGTQQTGWARHPVASRHSPVIPEHPLLRLAALPQPSECHLVAADSRSCECVGERHLAVYTRIQGLPGDKRGSGRGLPSSGGSGQDFLLRRLWPDLYRATINRSWEQLGPACPRPPDRGCLDDGDASGGLGATARRWRWRR